MKRLIYFLTVLMTVSFISHAAHADPHRFIANLSGSNEVPPVATGATGQAIVVLDATAQTIQISATFSGLGTNDTAAHIHCCLPASFLSGVNVGVATVPPAFPGFPLTVTFGTYVSPVFSLLDPTFYNTPFITAQG